MTRLVVVSPHLDDAVMSVGQLLAGHPSVTVATVCAGFPEPTEAGLTIPLTEYDRRCGFTSGADAVSHRRREDARACSLLDVEWAHLRLRDSQYGPALELGEVVAALSGALDRCDPRAQLAGPLGLLHPDHVTVRDAVLELGRARKRQTFLYAELPYRVTEWGAFGTALEAVQDGGALLAEHFLGTGDRERKRLAVAEYRSQRWAIEPEHCLVPELVWSVTWNR